MKKQTISKIAALGLAAMTVVPMFGISASADVKIHHATAGSPMSITGTAYRMDWSSTGAEQTWELTFNAASKKFSIKQVGSTKNHAFDDNKDLGGNNAGGSEYYAYSNIKPSAYVDLYDFVTKYNAEQKEMYDTFVTAYSNYNTDYDSFETAKNSAKSKTTYTDDVVNEQGTYEYTDKIGRKIKVTFTGNTKIANPTSTYTVKIDDAADATGLTDSSNVAKDALDNGCYTFKDYSNGAVADTPISDGKNITWWNVTVTPNVTTLKMDQLGQDIGSQYVTITDGVIAPTAVNKDTATGAEYYISAGAATDVNDPNETGEINDGVTSTQKPGDTTKPGNTNPGTTNPGTSTDVSNIPSSSTYSKSYPWYSTATKRYYRTYLEGVTASNGVGSVYDDTPSNTTTSSSIDSSSYYSSTYHWYSAYTGRYYRTYPEALAASNGYASYVSDSSASISSSAYYSTTYPWYSSLTRRYYRTYSDAVTASGGNSSYVSSGSATTVTTDPYTYYYNLLGTNNASSNKDTSNVTIGKSKGWTAVTKTINSAKSGSTYTVTMNGETTVPTSVMSALRGKNVNINFKLSNGVTYTINGTDIESTSAMDLYTRTGTKNVPTALKKKVVSANKGVSTSQLTISDSLNGSATLTVKFNTARAGRSAKLYRYNPAANSLTLVSTATVKSTGQTSFKNVSQSGDYIIVLS